ncbi:MAG: 50S ribosomal protein L3 [Candidatus Babeliales bacterium]|nr:50S ribosomal protein L3 [Candidatus Babeliales bacterium]
MTRGLWAKKIGMTQIFKNDKVVPVTIMDTSNWFITQIKTQANDGYDAIQVACVRDRYAGVAFDNEWLKSPKKYFVKINEIKTTETNNLEVGASADFSTSFPEGTAVDIMGVSKGAGFQGVVKRHNFRGGAASHGDQTGRKPGGMSFMRSRGRVIKGKKLPGHMGVERVTMKNLEIVKIDTDSKVMFVKGSLPGKSGSFVFVKAVDTNR